MVRSEGESKGIQGQAYDVFGFRTVNLGEQFSAEIFEQVDALNGTQHEPKDKREFRTYYNAYRWLRLYFGPDKFDDDKLFSYGYRGYLMVEPEDISKALEKLLKVAGKRQDEGKDTLFKVLTKLGYSGDYLNPQLGEFVGLRNSDPRIAIYGSSADMIKEIMAGLIDEGWDSIEANRVAMAGGVKRGVNTNYFKYRRGRVWKSMNWNDSPGHIQDQATL